MTEKLKYVSADTVESLRENVSSNLPRYRSGDFSDLMAQGEWSIDLRLDVDLAPLADLDPSGTPEAEIKNSKLVWRVLNRLTPSLAYEEGIWVRLAHVECLDYARQRWLDPDAEDDKIEEDVRTHFFARTLTGRRDDNAVSRLWWNAWIANYIMPGPDLTALEMFLKKADFRLSFIERSGFGSRPALAAGVIRIMQCEPWVTQREESFRAFMRSLNKLGGGVVFEAMNEEVIDRFMLSCAQRAGMPFDDDSDEVSASPATAPEGVIAVVAGDQ